MNPFRFYEIYSAITLHFSDKASYDFFKYGGKTRVSSDSFLKRNDKYLFEKMSKRFDNEDDAILFFAVNCFKGNKYLLQMKEDNYREFIGYRDSILYRFKDENSKLDSFNISDIVQENVKPEFLIIYDFCTNGKLFNKFDSQSDLLWEDYKKNLIKYQPFVCKYMNLQSLKSQLVSILLEKSQ